VERNARNFGFSSAAQDMLRKWMTEVQTEAQQNARAWLPEAMLFPAVDADAPAATEDEPESVNDLSDEVSRP
jgi:hypothetical protein